LSASFTVRTIFAGEDRVEALEYDLIPANDQGKAVCNLFLDFLSGRPAEFREKLPFLKHGNTELEWAAAAGGAALAAFFEDDQPVSMGIFLTGVNEESDDLMVDALRRALIQPLFGEPGEAYLQVNERPLLLNVIFPGYPELIPRTQLLSAALASVFFRVMIEMHAQSQPSRPEP
jgi:hypothetical protein